MMLVWTMLLQLHSPVIINDPLKVKYERRDTTVNFIVLHYDESPSYKATRQSLRKKRLSYHYYISRDGKIIQLLDPSYKASHVGLSFFKGYFRINNYSIGICLQNAGKEKYTNQQYENLAYLIKTLQTRFPDSTSHVIVGHKDVAIPFGRKYDPGKTFDWNRLYTSLK